MISKNLTNERLNEFVKAFTIAMIKAVKYKRILIKEREVINADLVPRTSKRVWKKSLISLNKPEIHKAKKPVLKKIEKIDPVVPSLAFPKKTEKLIPKPVLKKRPIQKRVIQQRIPIQKPISAPIPIPQQQNIPASKEEFGRITLLLNDPSVSSIECQGPGKQITIIRAGQRQFTKIALNPNEIRQILEKVSEKAHIPVLEGVFKAAIDNFLISAVISDVVGSRFIIKKSTPYSILEKN